MKTKKFISFIRGVFRISTMKLLVINYFQYCWRYSTGIKIQVTILLFRISFSKFASAFLNNVQENNLVCHGGLLRIGLITTPNYCKYFLLFKLIAEHTTGLTFIQLVESNCCNVSGRKILLAAKFIRGQQPYNAGDRGLDKSDSLY